METPLVRLSEHEKEEIYEPSEDSFLLIDALEQDLDKLRSTKPCACLEIGSGSGIVLTALALAAKKSWPSYFLALDLNPKACKITKRTSLDNSIDLDVIRMDLTSAICTRNIFDVIIFNPPYVVTETSEITNDEMITRSWAGGKKGREVMNRVFDYIPELLSKNGVFYLLVLRENDPSEIGNIFENFHMSGEIVMERRIRGEHLHVMRFSKYTTNHEKKSITT